MFYGKRLFHWNIRKKGHFPEKSLSLSMNEYFSSFVLQFLSLVKRHYKNHKRCLLFRSWKKGYFCHAILMQIIELKEIFCSILALILKHNVQISSVEHPDKGPSLILSSQWWWSPPLRPDLKDVPDCVVCLLQFHYCSYLPCWLLHDRSRGTGFRISKKRSKVIPKSN